MKQNIFFILASFIAWGSITSMDPTGIKTTQKTLSQEKNKINNSLTESAKQLLSAKQITLHTLATCVLTGMNLSYLEKCNPLICVAFLVHQLNQLNIK